MARKKQPATTTKITYHCNRVKVLNSGQQKYLDSIISNDITFCTGAAGCGKTHISCGVAVNLLYSGVVKKIVITRPVQHVGMNIGYLPGTFEEKLNPFLIPIFDELQHFIPQQEIVRLKTNGFLEIAPLQYMRGRTLKEAFVIVDESSNCTLEELKMVLTRIGKGSKYVLTADPSQSDLPPHLRGGITHCMERLQDIEGIGLIELDSREIVRHPLIEKMLAKLNA
jgi:phosphate starvation-inducible PhoH-like protein